MSTVTRCVYVPRMLNYHTTQSVDYWFNKLLLRWANKTYGNIFINVIVKRVDFVVRKVRTPEGESVCDKTVSAFVHVDLYNKATPILDAFLEASKNEKFLLCEDIDYHLVPIPNIHYEYWMILPANNPIPETRLNIHQLAENNRLLEEKVKSQEDTINSLLEENETIKKDVRRLQETVYQVIGKVFDHETESHQIYGLVNYMDYAVHNNRGWYFPWQNKEIKHHTNEDIDDCDFSISTESSVNDSSYNRVRNTVELCDNH